MYQELFIKLLDKNRNLSAFNSSNFNILAIYDDEYESNNCNNHHNYSQYLLTSIKSILQILHDWIIFQQNTTACSNHNLNLVLIQNSKDYDLINKILIDLLKTNTKYKNILNKIIEFYPPNAKGFYTIHFDDIKIIIIIDDSLDKSIQNLQIKYNLFDILSTNSINSNLEINANLEKLLKPKSVVLSSIPLKNSIIKFIPINNLNNHISQNCEYSTDYHIYEYNPEPWKYAYYDNYYNKQNYQTAVVIGGGIAGANIAFRLAKLGIATTIIDKGDIASGASGNPIGILKPHASADDNINSQLSRSAVHYVKNFLNNYFFNQIWWQLNSVKEYFRHDITKINSIKNWLDIDINQGILNWHTGIALQPKLLINALLEENHNLVKIISNTKIKHIHNINSSNSDLKNKSSSWNISFENQYGQSNINTDLLFICNAFEATDLVNSIYSTNNIQKNTQNNNNDKINLHKVHGQISGIPQHIFDIKDIPQQIISGKGYIVKDISLDLNQHNYNQNLIWTGATYEHNDNLMSINEVHMHNIKLIQDVIPNFMPEIKHIATNNSELQFNFTKLFKHRQATRAVCSNHLPIAGKIPYLNNAYILSGLSSHGLSWSHICADAIMAEISNGIYPWSKTLHKACYI